MTICVSAELENLSEELKEKGYTIVNVVSDVPCDAIICNLKDNGLLNLNMQSNIKREGTLIIDCGCKSFDEIENILANRVYSSLF
jgi:hypothetical protein